MRNLLVLMTMMVPFGVYAEASEPTYVPPMVVSTDGMVQMVGSLLLVLAVIGAIAWLLKRYALSPGAASNGIKIIATAGVGQRERIVIVEVEGTRLVLGVAPGCVNTLHRIDIASGNMIPETDIKEFSGKLSQTIEKNYAK